MRSLTAAVQAAATAENVRRTLAVQMDFASGMVRMTGAPFDIVISGNTFLGVGQLGSISAAEEGAELQAYRMSVTLSAIPRDMVSIALNQNYQKRAATVWEVLLDANNAVIADPIVIFRGRMDQMEIVLGQTATVTVTMENRLADWERPRISRFSAEDQETKYPGDLGLRYAAAMENKEIVWPARGWFSSQPSSGGGWTGGLR